jgi:ATP-binding cassette subfamily F protein uup
MAKLQGEIATLQQRLADPALFTRDRKSFDEISAALVKAQTELQAAEERWLELEIIREEIEGG